MRKWLIILLWPVVGPAAAQDLAGELGAIAAANGLVGMSVVATCGDQITDVYHYGEANISLGLAVGDGTRYRIASISKLVTAIGLLRLWEQGAFGLDDDVSGALGFTLRNPQYPMVPITYRMLLAHKSSLQDGTGYGDFLSATYANAPPPPISGLVQPGGQWYTANLWRTESPGSWFTYSNLNYGVIGTLIEALSGERFDVYMRAQVLEPLGIGGSYNVQDLDDLDQLAALYRNNIVQADGFNGVMPPAPDLSGYTPGTNGLYFSPQGGLRVSALELARVPLLLQGQGSWNGTTLLAPATVGLMLSDQWTWNGSNGDNYYGLFRSWGLGVHRANAEPGSDVVFTGVPMVGHPGEAYGLISDLYLDPVSGSGLIFITNGYAPGNAYVTAVGSAFYTVEAEVFGALREYAYGTCAATSMVEGIASPDLALVREGTVSWRGSGPARLTACDMLGGSTGSKIVAQDGQWSVPGTGPRVVRAEHGSGVTAIIVY